MRRAATAGVATIEHGDGGDDEVFELMAERKRGALPDAHGLRGARPGIRGYRPGIDPEPARMRQAREEPSRRRSAAGVDDRQRQRHRASSPTATGAGSWSCWSTSA